MCFCLIDLLIIIICEMKSEFKELRCYKGSKISVLLVMYGRLDKVICFFLGSKDINCCVFGFFSKVK